MRIAVIRLRRFGDILTTTPLLAALRRTYPHARIDVVVQRGHELVLANNPDVTSVVGLAPGVRPWLRFARRCRALSYDLAIDAQGSPRSYWCARAIGARRTVGRSYRHFRTRLYHRAVHDAASQYVGHIMAHLADCAGVTVASSRPVLQPLPSERAWAVQALAAVPERAPLLVVSGCARDPRKRWPAAHYQRIIARAMREFGMHVRLTCAPGEENQARELVDGLDAAAQILVTPTFGALGAVYEHAALWMGNDGAPKHVATAMGCRAIMIAGSYHVPKPYAEAALAKETWLVPGPTVLPGVYDVGDVAADTVWTSVCDALAQPHDPIAQFASRRQIRA